MYLNKPFWSDAVKAEAEAEQQSPVAELVKSLDKQRLYREVTLALRTGLREARAEFSFLRIRGLRSILKFLRSVAQSDDTINLFCHSQSIPALQGSYPTDLTLQFVNDSVYLDMQSIIRVSCSILLHSSITLFN